MSFSDNVALAHRWMELFNAQDIEGLVGLYAEDCSHTSPKIRAMFPDTQGRLSGKDALRKWWKDATARLPQLRYETLHVTADEHRVVVEYLRHAQGQPVLPVAEVFEVLEGKITASFVYHG